VYHVLNRANARRRIFEKDADYVAFERTLAEVRERIPMRILAWCVMPNHWHLVLWPRHDGELSEYMRLVTLTHAQRWHAHRDTAGTGHLYQGRFKSFAVQNDAHFLTVCRYVEANALRAGLVKRAEDWQWCSLWRAQRHCMHKPPQLEEWPVARPRDWIAYVNEATAPAELDAVRRSAQRGTPYGHAAWVDDVARRLHLQCTLRLRGRPEKRGQDPFSLAFSLGLPEKGSDSFSS
jgi:putative transposase